MTASILAKTYGVAILVCLVMDVIWLGVVAKGFYQRELGHLMAAEVRWVPAALFYLVFVAALVVIVVAPSVEKESLGRAVGFGAFFGLAAYAAFDLTSLALLRDFPLKAAMVDLVWGSSMSATVSGAAYLAAGSFR